MNPEVKKQVLKALKKLCNSFIRLCFSLLTLVYATRVVIDIVTGKDIRLDLALVLILIVQERIEAKR